MVFKPADDKFFLHINHLSICLKLDFTPQVAEFANLLYLG